jgi:hypothetical protein
MSLIKTQRNIIDYPLNSWTVVSSTPIPVGFYDFMTRDQKNAASRQCNEQLIRSTSRVQNFHFESLVCIIVIGLSTILIELFIEPLDRWISVLGSGSGSKQFTRDRDGKFYLLCRSLECLGISNWRIGSWGVPVTDDHIDSNLLARYTGKGMDESIDLNKTIK